MAAPSAAKVTTLALAVPIRVQMKRDHSDQCIGALERAIDKGAASLNHAPLLVHFEEDDQPCGSRHSTSGTSSASFCAADATLFHNGSYSYSAAVDLGSDTLARELVAKPVIRRARNRIRSRVRVANICAPNSPAIRRTAFSSSSWPRRVNSARALFDG